MTKQRRRELEARVSAGRKRRPEPAPFTRLVPRGPAADVAPPAPVYTAHEDGGPAVPRRPV